MLRAAALSLLMVFSLVTMLPETSSSAFNNEKSASSSRKKRVRKHSRAWWRRYRARQRRRRAAMAHRRALAAMRAKNLNPVVAGTDARIVSTKGGVYTHPRGLWSVTTPTGWSSQSTMGGSEMQFRIFADGRAAGQATLSVVGMATAASEGSMALQRKPNRTLSGVPLTALRRTVIDRMVKEGGWVVNDFQREIGGRRVFVVQAQTPATVDGRTPTQAQTYYFTEVDGRIYALATSAPVDASDRVATESEKMMATLRSGQQASLR